MIVYFERPPPQVDPSPALSTSLAYRWGTTPPPPYYRGCLRQAGRFCSIWVYTHTGIAWHSPRIYAKRNQPLRCTASESPWKHRNKEPSCFIPLRNLQQPSFSHHQNLHQQFLQYLQCQSLLKEQVISSHLFPGVKISGSAAFLYGVKISGKTGYTQPHPCMDS